MRIGSSPFYLSGLSCHLISREKLYAPYNIAPHQLFVWLCLPSLGVEPSMIVRYLEFRWPRHVVLARLSAMAAPVFCPVPLVAKAPVSAGHWLVQMERAVQQPAEVEEGLELEDQDRLQDEAADKQGAEKLAIRLYVVVGIQLALHLACGPHTDLEEYPLCKHSQLRLHSISHRKTLHKSYIPLFMFH